MSKEGPKSSKIRVRKAPTLREQAEAARAKTDAISEPSKLLRVKSKLPKTGLLRQIWGILALVFRPLKPLVRPLKWLVPRYLVNSWREVRLVTWPSRRETWRLTLAVFVFAIIFGSLVAGVDKVIDLLFKKVVLKQ